MLLNIAALDIFKTNNRVIICYSSSWCVSYDECGNCVGKKTVTPLEPTKLRWNLSNDCQKAIDASYRVALNLLEDVDLRLIMFR